MTLQDEAMQAAFSNMKKGAQMPEPKSQTAPAGGDPTAATPQPPLTVADEPVDDGKVRLVVALQPRHHEYLCQRAASFGHTPEVHLEIILREFRSFHDKHRPDIANLPAAQPGMPAMALPR